jgi:hypothetical protein
LQARIFFPTIKICERIFFSHTNIPSLDPPLLKPVFDYSSVVSASHQTLSSVNQVRSTRIRIVNKTVRSYHREN